MRRFCAISILVALSACSSARPPAVAPDPRLPERLAEADRLVRAGCLDCLIAAYGEYDLLRAFPAARDAATLGAIRSAGLIALRQRELGQVDEGYLRRARTLAAGSPTLPAWAPTIVDVIDALPPSGSAMTRTPTSDLDLERARLLRVNHDAWSAALKEVAGVDELGAYTWLSFMCGATEARTLSLDELTAPAAAFKDTPLIAYKRALCRGFDRERLEALFVQERRFIETRFNLGVAAVAARKLDDAEKLFNEAYAWRTEWPALTQSIAHLAMSAEEFEQALTFYNRTLEMEPHAVDALLGKVRALTFLGRSADAIAVTDLLLAERWFLGDAHYWRALNEAELERYDEGWADIEAAAKLMINADVPKVAGLIAYHRRQLDVSRAKFEESLQRNGNDCETAYYLGIVLGELAVWDRTATILTGAGTCLEAVEKGHLWQIEQIRASTDPPERQAKKIARREQYIAKGRRQMATSWFNVAVAYYNLAKKPEARQFAERVADDEQFGARAKDILSRLRDQN